MSIDYPPAGAPNSANEVDGEDGGSSVADPLPRGPLTRRDVLVRAAIGLGTAVPFVATLTPGQAQAAGSWEHESAACSPEREAEAIPGTWQWRQCRAARLSKAYREARRYGNLVEADPDWWW
jgi:hypothetical protein